MGTRSVITVLVGGILAIFLSSCGDTYPLGAAYAPCYKNSDCPSGVCNVYTGQCELEGGMTLYCRSDADCDEEKGEICFYLTGTCRVACNRDEQCAEDEYCDVVTGLCRPLSKRPSGAGDDDDNDSGSGTGELFDPCTKTSDCREGLFCEEDICIPESGDDDDNGGLYDRCKSDEDCDEGLVCLYEFCVPPQEGDDDDTGGGGGLCDLCGNPNDCAAEFDCIFVPLADESYCATTQQEAAECYFTIGDDDDATGGERCDPCTSPSDCGGGYDCVTVPYVNEQLCAADVNDAVQCILNPPTDDDDSTGDPCPVGECTEIQGYQFCLENGQPPRGSPRCNVNNPSCPEDGQVPVQAQTSEGQVICICLYDCSDVVPPVDDDDDVVDTHCLPCSTRGDCGNQYDCVTVPYVNMQICANDIMDAAQCLLGGGGSGGGSCTAECSPCSTASQCCDGLDCVNTYIQGSICATDLMGAAQCFLGGGGSSGAECDPCSSNGDCNQGLTCESNPLTGDRVCTANGAIGAAQCALGGGGGMRSCQSDADCIPIIEQCMFGFCIPLGGGGGFP
ncbi:MAG: hypothetical protein Kow0090_10510 [Myxococcota bacterium]